MAGGDWRHGTGGGKKPPEPSRGTSRRAWQPGAAKPTPTGGKRSRTGRLLFAGFAASVVLGLIVVLIWWWWPGKYPALVVVAPNAAGSLGLPENAAGHNAAAALDEWARDGDKKPHLNGNPADTAGKDAWQGRIDVNARSIVLYFAAHGGADAKGPFLWFPAADGKGLPEKLHVRDILDRLASLPKDREKLVIFDAARVPASWPHGSVSNDFARALNELDADIARIEGLVVVCASDADQRSWVSEEWRQSVFGHFFLEGLKGATANPGDRISADRLFDYVSGEVNKWAVANRDENQKPMLLPKDDGRNRAATIELAAVPPAGYQAPTRTAPPDKVPQDLEAAWAEAMRLATERTPAPDAADPAVWREYLDLLLRWDRLVRMGDDPEPVRKRALGLAEQLGTARVAAEPGCLPTAIPAARALGFPGFKVNDADFAELWTPKPGTTRGSTWTAKSGPARAAATNLTVAEVVRRKPTPDVLATADDVLGVVDGPAPGTAEGHFLRMLKRQLDAKQRPGDDLLTTAINLRVTAEKAAWVGGTDDGSVYPEQLFRWVRGHVEKGDEARELGQDLLFHTDPKSWEEAKAVHFPAAQSAYDKARDDAKVVAAALAYRDRVLARLPYYARWAAGDRRKPAADAEKLLKRVEETAAAAHAIAAIANKVPDSPTERTDAVKQLAGHTARGNAEFAEVVKAFDLEVRDLGNVEHPSNWHALDNALSVPFMPARDRVRLLNHVRSVSYALADPSRGENLKGNAAAPPVSPQEAAKRQARMARAILGDPTDELRKLIDRDSYREFGDRIGARFRNLSSEVKAESQQADGTPKLTEAAPYLGQAAYLARLADPGCPVAGDAPAAEQRYWRHYLLLWQAERAIRAGWADVGTTAPDQWYCRRVARLFIDSARDYLRITEETERLVADIRAAEKLQPTVFTLVSPKERGLADEPNWKFEFTMTPTKGGPLGFPVYWLTPPGPPYTAADPALDGRKLEPKFARSGAATVTEQTTFTAIPRPEDVDKPGKLGTTVLYRGHRYESQTDIRLAGTPTLDYRYLPPKGPAAFAVLADKELVRGTVTILIDLTKSMALERVDDRADSPKRIEAAKQGLELILRQLPRGTTVTLASFYGVGNGEKIVTNRLTAPVTLDDTNDARDRLWKAVKDLTADGENTPLAGAIREVLVDTDKKFWPAEITGLRTLIVLTDGVDNWGPVYQRQEGKTPGSLALEALKDAQKAEDVLLHIVFFGMGSGKAKDEQQEAVRQFEVLEQDANFRKPPRTKGRLWKDILEAKELADVVKEAMLPRVYFVRENTVEGQSGAVTVSLPDERLYRSSGAVQPGVYDLWGTQARQSLRLDPGDRLLMRAVPKGKGFDVMIPPFAHETADAMNLPRATEATADRRNGIHVTIPELNVEESATIGKWDLGMVATLEPVGGAPGDRLRSPRPDFPWFELAYADGEPADPTLKTGLRVVNRPGLVAPAWDVQAVRWDVNRGKGTVRRPALSAYWIEGPPNAADTLSVDLGNIARLKPKESLVRGVKVEWLDVRFEELPAGDVPAGKYLTVRLSYGEPGKPVFLRPGKLKGPEQRFLLAERHIYFDGQARYTARFGPLEAKDLEGTVELELYPVAELKERAADRNAPRAATVRFPMERPMNAYGLPDKLRRVTPEK